MQMFLVPLYVKSALLGNIITKPREASVQLALEADTPEEMRRHLSDVVPVLLQRNHGISLAEEADKHTLDLNIKSILPWLEAEGLQGTRAAG